MGCFDTHYIISHDFMSCKCPPLVKRGKKDEKSVFCIVVRSFSSVTLKNMSVLFMPSTQNTSPEL